MKERNRSLHFDNIFVPLEEEPTLRNHINKAGVSLNPESYIILSEGDTPSHKFEPVVQIEWFGSESQNRSARRAIQMYADATNLIGLNRETPDEITIEPITRDTMTDS